MLYPWIIVHLVVTLLVGLAWVLVSTCPDVDYTEGKFSRWDKIKSISAVALLQTSEKNLLTLLIRSETLMAMKIEHPRTEEKGGINA